MGDHTLELIRQLCTRAGMIMEDASVEALLMRAADSDARVATLERLRLAVHPIDAGIAAARTRAV